MNILARIQKSRDFWALLIISLVFFFLRFPSLFEPDWYGDEGVYQVVGMGLNAGRLLYRDVFDNKPPFLYILYSLVSSDLFLIRLLSLFAGLLSVIIFFYLSKKLFQNEKISILTTSIFAVLFGLPLIEGNIANAENFMLLPNILAGFIVIKSLENKFTKINSKIQLTAGVILGLSFLFKIVAVFDFAAFFLFIFFIGYDKKLSYLFDVKMFFKELKKYYSIILGFIIPIILTVLYFIFNNSFSYFITATFFSNIGYVGYKNQFIIPQGFLILKLLLLAGFVLYIFYNRKKFAPQFIFIALWFSFSLFDAFFSQRPYTHYLLILLPSFCLMLGTIFLNRNFSKLGFVLIVISSILIFNNFTFFGKTSGYYQNFLSFITGKEKVSLYQSFFDKSTPDNYEIAGFIKLYAKPQDNIFVWGNNAQVYYLTGKLPPGRYTVEYHITNYKDGFSNTSKALLVKKPEFIILMPNVRTYPFDLSGYFLRVNINNIEIYEKII